MRVCGFVWELWMWRTISCQWGYPYTALVEQALHRVSSNPMQLIHTKTSLNLPLNTTGKRLSASIVGGAQETTPVRQSGDLLRDPSTQQKWLEHLQRLNHSTWTRSVGKMWDFFHTRGRIKWHNLRDEENHLLCFIYLLQNKKHCQITERLPALIWIKHLNLQSLQHVFQRTTGCNETKYQGLQNIKLAIFHYMFTLHLFETLI